MFFLKTIKHSQKQIQFASFALLFILLLIHNQTAIAKFNNKKKASDTTTSFVEYLNIQYRSNPENSQYHLPLIPNHDIIKTQKVSLPAPIVTILEQDPMSDESATTARPLKLAAPIVTILGTSSKKELNKATKGKRLSNRIELTPITPSLSWETPSSVEPLQNNTLPKQTITHSSPKIAIVIDDIGNNKNFDTRVAKLPGAITLAILPHTPFSKRIARLGHNEQKEIMLHAPMESLNGRRLGDGALTKDLGELRFKEILQGDIDSIPHISGLNNHMGSSLTQDRQAMDWVMQSIEKNQLFFVDSRTTAESVAAELATQYKIKHVSRNIFLDNEATEEYIQKAFNKAIQISKKSGFALAIGHPYPATVKFLENNLHKLQREGVVLVSVSELLYAQAEKSDHNLTKNSSKKELAKK